LRFYFFFSSRRRHTRSKRDWSSDVCSSDLHPHLPRPTAAVRAVHDRLRRHAQTLARPARPARRARPGARRRPRLPAAARRRRTRAGGAGGPGRAARHRRCDRAHRRARPRGHPHPAAPDARGRGALPCRWRLLLLPTEALRIPGGRAPHSGHRRRRPARPARPRPPRRAGRARPTTQARRRDHRPAPGPRASAPPGPGRPAGDGPPPRLDRCGGPRTQPGREVLTMSRRPQTLRESLHRLAGTRGSFTAHLRPERPLIAGGLAALLAEVGMRLAEPWPLKFVIDGVIAEAGADGVPTQSISLQAVLLLACAALPVVVALRALAAYLMAVCFALVANRLLTSVRADLYALLQRLSMAFHDKVGTGDMVQRVTADVGRLKEVAVTAGLPLLGNLATLVGMVAVVAIMDWQLALVMLGVFPLFALIGVRLSRRIHTVSRTQRKA